MSWQIYTDSTEPVEDLSPWLDNAPPWRAPPSWQERRDKVSRPPPPLRPREAERGKLHVTLNDQRELTAINAALMLRRPLLVTGSPGIGKSNLAYSIAWRLGLGRPLRWEINSRTTLQDGLYDYDAVSHLRDGQERPIQDFITLGPLGTALLPTQQPRVLLIDELDKASYDLPNDLLHVFEEGAFKIPELIRTQREETEPIKVLPADYDPTRSSDRLVQLIGGQVQVHHHPVVVITTNKEREFTEAFRRRCVPLLLELPSVSTAAGREKLTRIITGWLGEGAHTEDILEAYGEENTDVLLQALFLWRRGVREQRDELHQVLSRKREQP